MTGIERLRELAGAVSRGVRLYDVTSRDYDEREGLSAVHCGGLLGEIVEDIAGQIAREHAEDCHGTGEPAAAEDAEAVAWVREHGGLEKVKKLLGWVVGHCSTERQLDFDFWLSGRVVHELGFEEDIADRDEVERRLLARLMPEGMEWPMVDGEPVVIGERLVGYGSDGDGYEVVGVRPSCGWILVKSYVHVHHGGEPVILEWDASKCRRPAPKVLDADGRPLCEGDKPYRVDNGKQVEVRRVDPDYGEECVFVGVDGTALGYWLRPDKLTHERPERKCRDCAHWQKDPTADKMGVCWFFYHEHEGQDCYAARLADICACEEFMPRAKALAERDSR